MYWEYRIDSFYSSNEMFPPNIKQHNTDNNKICEGSCDTED